MNNHDKDYHFFATDFTLDRVELKGLNTETPQVGDVPVTCFIPSDNEKDLFKNTLKILLAREMVTVPGFEWMNSILPDHIPHELEDDMAKKSEIFLLPVSLNNEISYSDCVHILDEYTEITNHWYSAAGRGGELDNLQIPVGGDQLTRVRLQGAKGLRAGARTAEQRFERLYPMVVEMFHVLQDFLEKLCKKFLNLSKGRDAGTLANMKCQIQRSNVNGKVKSRFKAHEDFVLTCGHSYFIAYIMKHFNITDGKPMHHALPDKIRSFINAKKREVFNNIMDEVVAEIFIPFELEEPITDEMHIQISIMTQPPVVFTTVARPDNGTVNVVLDVAGKKVIVSLKVDTLLHGCRVNIPGVTAPIKFVTFKPPKLEDDLNNYVVNFMQWYFIILQMKDALHEGDIYRINVILKQMIPFFYSHSAMSKYLTECIDYILKTEHTLSQQMSMKVRAASVVNPTGGIGNNKAADLQKENEVKYLKELIRGLGANKTEMAIVNVTRAAPVIASVCDAFDEQTKVKNLKSTHKVRSRSDDTSALLKTLQKLDIWSIHGGRQLQQKVKRSPFDFHRSHFKGIIKNTIKRLLRDLPAIHEDSDKSDSDDE
ncbi:uncharacterized protein LOC117320505 [Pecten maximus]|uniref:uncharacterized protein LOC117320505 n=1 Tax=Pecten maximus TaxID=6579 RepID=UPI001458C6EA|nr:uncharacterized protein LOC117320505 [Pecten maximus]